MKAFTLLSWLSASLLLASSDALRLDAERSEKTARATTPAPGGKSRSKPRPIVLTTTKPSTAKPNGGNGSSSTYYLYPQCSKSEVMQVINTDSYEVRQCMAFSTYNFARAVVPTPQQKQLLCDVGCYDLVNHLATTPVPQCSIQLGGRAVNYMDALYVVFANCAGSSPAIPPAPAPAPAPAPVAQAPVTAPAVLPQTPVASAAPQRLTHLAASVAAGVVLHALAA